MHTHTPNQSGALASVHCADSLRRIAAAGLWSILSFAGCGSDSSFTTGSGGGDGLVIQGVLTQGDEGAHGGSGGGTPPTQGSGSVTGRDVAQAVIHGAGQPIENVEVCTLGQCSMTDGLGQWGMPAPESFSGGEALFTVSGHGIDSRLVVHIPAGARDVALTFVNRGTHGVAATRMNADGVETALGGVTAVDDDAHVHDDSHSHD